MFSIDDRLQDVMIFLAIREIAANAGVEPSVVISKFKENKGNYGYNAKTGEYGGMMAMGIIDPTKVVLVALQICPAC